MAANRSSRFLVIILFFVAACAAPVFASPQATLRYDGVYRSKRIADYWNYLRFYSDGTVIEVSSTGKPKDLRKWFSKDNASHPSIGKITIKGNHLSFSVVSTEGTVDYTGEIRENRIRLRSYSHINEHRATRVYSFIKW